MKADLPKAESGSHSHKGGSPAFFQFVTSENIMKTKDILEMERGNTNCINLVREGMFLRAYERSALFFIENVAPFQITKRYFKVIDCELVYLGFPASNITVLLQRAGIERSVNADSKLITIYGFSTGTDFNTWKASFKSDDKEKDVSKELIRETVDATGMPDDLLHLYKSGFDLMVEIYRLTSNFTREYKFTVGEQLKSDAFEIALLCYRMALEKSEDGRMSMVHSIIEQMRLRLRLMLTLKEISTKAFSRINIQIEYLYDRTGGGQKGQSPI